MKERNRENSFLAKLSYGMADIYGGGAFVVISTFFIVFLTDAIGMKAGLAGLIPLVGKVWDAITDPIMGNIADRTTSKFGAKRFFILIGAVVSSITFLLMWITLPINSKAGLFFFYMLMYILFSTGFTIVMVPYNALLPDMVEDYTTRAKFSGARMICSTFGAIIAGLIPTILIPDSTNNASYFKVAAIFAVIFLVVILLTFFGTWEKQKEPVKTTLSSSFVQTFTVFKNKTFRMFIGIFLLGQGAADVVTSLAVYYVKDVIDCYHDGMFTILMGVLLLAQFIGTIIFSNVSKKNKRLPILVGFPIRIVASLGLLLVSHKLTVGEGFIKMAYGNIPGDFLIVLVLCLFIGLGMAASSTTIYAILADMADVDELVTSINRPGTCSAMATFVRKIANGLSVALIGGLLSWVGYKEAEEGQVIVQSAQTQHGIALLFVLVPIVFMVGTLIVTFLFPLGKKEFDIVKKEIARRKGEDDSVITAEEKAVCEKVTGFAYENLWDKENAYHK